jgi:hypothetical protein
MTAVPLPPASGPRLQRTHFDLDPLQHALRERHRIEIPIFPAPDGAGRLLRVACALHVEHDDVTRLLEALSAEGIARSPAA